MYSKVWWVIILAAFAQLSGGHAGQAPGEIRLSDSPRLCGTMLIPQLQQALVENTRRLQPGMPASLSKESEAQVEVGDTLSFYTINYKLNVFETIMAVCLYKADYSYIFAGTTELSEDKITPEAVERFYQTFEIKTPAASINPDLGIRQIVNQYIGPTPTTFEDNRLYILIHDIIDEFDPAASKFNYVAGYFYYPDLTSGAYSNKKNLIHVDCSPLNPAGEDALATVAHEFQHLIHFSFDPDETTTGLWVNEGASEYTEVLCGFPVRNPKGYLQRPDRSLTVFDGFANDLLDYKKVALWTYYLAEKFGPELIGEIVREPKNSVEGVRSALSKRGIALTFEDIFANFVIANYADDPSLDATGHLGYEKLTLPAVPPATQHRVYPVSPQSKTVSQYAAFYSRFLSADTTAVLQINNQPTDIVRDRIYKKGTVPTVEEIILDAAKKGSYSLRAIGQGVDEMVLAAISLGTVSVCTYSVTSDYQDIYPPVLTSGPDELLPTGGSVTILWETDEPASSIVEYGATQAYGQQYRDTSFVTQHNVSLVNLQPNTTYHYRVGSVDARGNGPAYSADFYFTTSNVTAGVVATLQQKHSYGYWGRSLVRSRDGILHLLYHEIVGARRFVYHIRTADNGAHWSAPQVIGQMLDYSGMPSVALDSLGRLHAAWHGKEMADSKYGVYYSRSDDNGSTWSPPLLISTSLTEVDQLYAAIATDANNNPHVVWNTALYTTENTGDVLYAHSADGGSSWSADRMISASSEHHCFVPTIDFTSTGTAHVLWVDGVFSQQTLKAYGTSSGDYENWQTPAALTRSGVLYDAVVSFVIDPQDRLHLVFTDNYTPGDIRVMYAQLAGGMWSEPALVAKSPLGNVDGPHISSDNAGDLYLLYRDDMGTVAMNKNIQGAPHDEELPGLRKEGLVQTGEIFFSIYHNGAWSPAVNLSNDAEDDSFGEMPRRMHKGLLDAIWMRVLSATQNQLRYLHLDIAPPASTAPLKISAVYPADGAENIPYLRQAFVVRVDFDQRIEPDSLSNTTVSVQSQTQGAIAGSITWESSNRRLEFTANASLPASDLITVRVSGALASEAGVGLDGNGNGASEGSPIDDYVWSFQTQELDIAPPIFSIGILQNPVLTRYMDIYIIPSEMLGAPPSVTVNGQTVLAQVVQGQSVMYKAGYRLEQNGILIIEASGDDLSGNNGTGSRDFSAQLMLAERGGEMYSADALFKLTIRGQTLANDCYITITKENKDPAESHLLATYQVSPSSLILSAPVEMAITVPDFSGQVYFLEQKAPDGQWFRVDSKREGKRLMAKLDRLGAIRLMSGAAAVPVAFALRQNYPNPFRLLAEQTTLVFELPDPAAVEVTIYNLLGQRIRTLIDQPFPAGVHSLNWDGRDDAQDWLASGVYFYRCRAGDKILTRKLLLLQ